MSVTTILLILVLIAICVLIGVTIMYKLELSKSGGGGGGGGGIIPNDGYFQPRTYEPAASIPANYIPVGSDYDCDADSLKAMDNPYERLMRGRNSPNQSAEACAASCTSTHNCSAFVFDTSKDTGVAEIVDFIFEDPPVVGKTGRARNKMYTYTTDQLQKSDKTVGKGEGMTVNMWVNDSGYFANKFDKDNNRVYPAILNSGTGYKEGDLLSLHAVPEKDKSAGVDWISPRLIVHVSDGTCTITDDCAITKVATPTTDKSIYVRKKSYLNNFKLEPLLQCTDKHEIYSTTAETPDVCAEICYDIPECSNFNYEATSSTCSILDDCGLPLMGEESYESESVDADPTIASYTQVGFPCLKPEDAPMVPPGTVIPP